VKAQTHYLETVRAYAQNGAFSDLDKARFKLSLTIAALLPAEEELVWRKMVAVHEVKLTHPVISDGYRTLHGRRWPGRRIKVIDFNAYVCFTDNLWINPNFTLFAVRVPKPQANRIERWLRRPWLGVL
jgi:hypothetical protein